LKIHQKSLFFFSRDRRGNAIKLAKFETELNFWKPLSLSLPLFPLNCNSSRAQSDYPRTKSRGRKKSQRALNVSSCLILHSRQFLSGRIYKIFQFSRFNADAFCILPLLPFFFSSSRCTLMGRVCLSIPDAHTRRALWYQRHIVATLSTAPHIIPPHSSSYPILLVPHPLCQTAANWAFAQRELRARMRAFFDFPSARRNLDSSKWINVDKFVDRNKISGL